MGIDRDPFFFLMAINNNVFIMFFVMSSMIFLFINNDLAYGSCQECRYTKRQLYISIISMSKRRCKRTIDIEKSGVSTNLEILVNNRLAEV